MVLPDPPTFMDEAPPITEMAIQYLTYHLEVYEARRKQFEALKTDPSSAFHTEGVPNLQAVAAAQIVKSLRENPAGNIEKMITDSIPAHLWDPVMKDPRIHYSSFRWMNSKRAEEGALGEGDEVDEWIQKNEKWMRVNGTDWGLITLDDVKAIFPTATHTPTEIKIPRRQPPSTSFCFLDDKRPSSISILPSTAQFIATFNRVTNNCLKGLDWSNVFLAGGMPLNTLLCTDPTLDNPFPDSDLDLYIHGLPPHKANEKINHIYSVWSSNVGPSSTAAGLCIKNSKTVNLLGRFPDRRIQIVLKIVKTPAEVLLNFDLDPCAIGFDGKKVFMLPRAARALETGYTTFTMHLIHGHHLGDRRATQEQRIYKYASRGFGIRILPAYMGSLSLDPRQRVPHTPAANRGYHVQKTQDGGPTALKGLKAVKRVAWAAEDMVRRFVLNEVDGEVQDDQGLDWRNWVAGPNGQIPVCSFRVLDAYKQHIGQPGGRMGIGSFELFFRHCAAWKLECEGRLKIDYNDFADMYQTEGAYDDLPSFTWNSSFNPNKYMEDINTYNYLLHRNMLGLFDHLEDGQERWDACQLGNMKIPPARIVHAKTLQGVLDQQVAIPVFISRDLEERLDEMYSVAMNDTGLDDPLFYCYLDVNNNLMVRLWLIGNQTMWARIDRTIDEVFEILWTFFHIQQLTPGRVSAVSAGDDEDEFDPDGMEHLLREHLERRVPRPTRSSGSKKSENFFDWPSKEEHELFDFWMREYPRAVYRGEEAPFCATGAFNESDNLREPEEERYWGSEDEKEEGKVWRDIVEEIKRKRKRIDSQLIEGEKFPRV